MPADIETYGAESDGLSEVQAHSDHSQERSAGNKSELPNENARVMPAKAKTVAHGIFNRGPARRVGNIVKITQFVGFYIINGRRKFAAAHGKTRNGQFNATGSA